MEVFSLLAKYLRGGTDAAATAVTLIEADDGIIARSSDGGDGPYFDLEFTLPEDDSDQEESTEKSNEDDIKSRQADKGEETENLSSHNEDSENGKDSELKENVAISPADELFLNGELVPIDESSSVLLHDSEENGRFPVSLLKSATKFGVVLLKLKKSKTEQTEDTSKTDEENHCETGGRKFFTLKFKVQEVKMSFASLFSGENDSNKEEKRGKENSESNGVSEDRKLLQKYLKKVKLLYVRVSEGYGQLNVSAAKTCGITPPPHTAVSTPVKSRPKKQWNINYLQMVGKSRPATAAVAADPATMSAANRRDDSLLEMQDGIQGAILHCKRSFNASSGT